MAEDNVLQLHKDQPMGEVVQLHKEAELSIIDGRVLNGAERARDLMVARVVHPVRTHARGWRPVRGTVSTAGYGVLGLGRAGQAAWRWVSAAELEQHLAGKPDLVVKERARRRKVAAWVGGGTLLAFGVAVQTEALLVGLIALVILMGAGVVERILRRAPGEGSHGERPAIGKEPSRKAVRQAFANAKVGKVDDISVLTPGTQRTPEGNAWMAVVQFPEGVTYKETLKKLPGLASAMGVGLSQLALDPVRGNEGRGIVWCADSDPLSGPPIPSPLLKLDRPFDFWNDRIPVGGDVRGRPLDFSLVERTLLVGGEQGGGKSVLCNNVLCAIALDPYMRMILIDGKGVDLLDYAEIAETLIAKPDPAAFLNLLDELIAEMEERYDLMGKLRVKKITEDIAAEYGLHPIFLHVDELAFFTRSDLGADITEKLRDIVSRGRAAAIITSAATQRPSAKVIDTDLRDLMQVRIALRCSTNSSSDMILSQGWASAGFSAKDIDMEQRGAGLILHEGSQPVRMRSNMLTDPQITELCRRAYRLREKVGTLPKSDARPLVRLLKAMLTVMGEGDRMHTDRILAGLSERSADYDGWDASRLAGELPQGIRPQGTEGVKAIASDGVERNRNGYRRVDLQRALDRA